MPPLPKQFRTSEWRKLYNEEVFSHVLAVVNAVIETQKSRSMWPRSKTDIAEGIGLSRNLFSEGQRESFQYVVLSALDRALARPASKAHSLESHRRRVIPDVLETTLLATRTWMEQQGIQYNDDELVKQILDLADQVGYPETLEKMLGAAGAETVIMRPDSKSND